MLRRSLASERRASASPAASLPDAAFSSASFQRNQRYSASGARWTTYPSRSSLSRTPPSREVRHMGVPTAASRLPCLGADATAAASSRTPSHAGISVGFAGARTSRSPSGAA